MGKDSAQSSLWGISWATQGYRPLFRAITAASIKTRYKGRDEGHRSRQAIDISIHVNTGRHDGRI